MIFLDPIARFFLEDIEVMSIMKNIMTMYCIVLVPDLCLNTFSAYLRNFGEENFVMKVFLYGYYGVCIPIATIATHVLKLNYWGAWLSFCVSCLVVFVIITRKLLSIDMDKRIVEMNDRAKIKEPTKEIELEEVEVLRQ